MKKGDISNISAQEVFIDCFSFCKFLKEDREVQSFIHKVRGLQYHYNIKLIGDKKSIKASEKIFSFEAFKVKNQLEIKDFILNRNAFLLTSELSGRENFINVNLSLTSIIHKIGV